MNPVRRFTHFMPPCPQMPFVTIGKNSSDQSVICSSWNSPNCTSKSYMIISHRGPTFPPLKSGKKLTNIWQGDLEISFEETTSWQTASVFFGGDVLSCKTWYQPPDQSVRRFLPAISDASDSWHSPSSTQIDLLKLKPILKGCCTAHSNSGESFCFYHKLVLLVIKRCQICVRWGAPH